MQATQAVNASDAHQHASCAAASHAVVSRRDAPRHTAVAVGERITCLRAAELLLQSILECCISRHEAVRFVSRPSDVAGGHPQ